MSTEQISFEEALQRLEQLVGKLEDGNIPLEEAIELFQEGMRLSAFCTEKLDHFERKIEILIEEEGGMHKRPFQSTDGKEE
ncbi:MAG TPA: exodeoxyribonuclease VII small subunit [Bacilli bacterium]